LEDKREERETKTQKGPDVGSSDGDTRDLPRGWKGGLNRSVGAFETNSKEGPPKGHMKRRNRNGAIKEGRQIAEKM